MRGVGTASGAVTVVNALPTGVGCAVAVTLPVRSEVELRRSGGSGPHRVRIDRGADSPLVRETLQAGLARYAPGEAFSGDLRLRSSVPVAKGLKSSSAVGVAVLSSIADALRQSRAPQEIARLASEVAQEIGLSATGAYDDCLASVQGGVVLTDNATRTALRAAAFDTALEVLLWVPESRHEPSPGYLGRFREHAAAGQAAVDAAKAGDWLQAMTLNTQIVERVMGYDYSPLRSRLLLAGAAMAGVSGMGPALATFVSERRVPAVQAQLPGDTGEVLHVKVRSDGRLPSEGR